MKHVYRWLAVITAMVAVPIATVTTFAAPAEANCDTGRVFSISDARAYEGTGFLYKAFVFTVQASGCIATSVSYTTAEVWWGAHAPDDYQSKSGTLSWAAGDYTDRTIVVNVVRDSQDEFNENFLVNLYGAGGVIVDGTGLGEILDDDGPLTWNIDDVSCVEGDPSGFGIYTPCNFTVTLSQQQTAVTSVSYSTVDSSATAPADYVSASGVVTVPAGAPSATGTVLIRRDELCEGDQSFWVKIAGASVGSIADASGKVTIVEDDIFCF